jgi:hypothetical protein
METIVSQLKKRLDIYEGNKLETLSNNDLKSLSLKSKKTAHHAKVVLTKRLEDDAYHLKRLKDCAVCMDNVIDTVYLPCGHVKKIKRIVFDCLLVGSLFWMCWEAWA